MYGVSKTGGIESGVILSTVPIAMSFIAFVFFKEKLSTSRIAGIFLAVVGAVSINAMATHAANGSSHEDVLLGSLLLLCAVVCEAVFLTFGKLLSRPMLPERLSLLLASMGAVLFLIPASIEPNGLWVAHYSLRTWALMIYSGVAINGLAAVLMYDAMNSVDTTVASAFTALTPVSGTVLSVLFLGEALHGYHSHRYGFRRNRCIHRRNRGRQCAQENGKPGSWPGGAPRLAPHQHLFFSLHALLQTVGCYEGRQLKLKICLAGATGWAGAELARGIAHTNDLDMVAGISRSSAGQILGKVLNEEKLTCPIYESVSAASVKPFDVFVEYTTPTKAKANILQALKLGAHVVVGTSGLHE